MPPSAHLRRRPASRREEHSPLPDFTAAQCTRSPLNPDAWFPDPTEGPAAADPAARICATCPLSDPCFEYGRRKMLDGVWGGVFLRGGFRLTRRSPSSPSPAATSSLGPARR